MWASEKLFREGTGMSRQMIIQYEYFRSADLISILKLVSTTFEHSYHPGIFLASHDEWEEGFILARCGTKIVGFVMGKLLESQVRILLLAVTPGFRERGVGSRLLAHFEREVAKRGIPRIFLEVRVSNTQAIRFYRLHVFVETGHIPKFYSDGEGGVVMTKYLKT